MHLSIVVPVYNEEESLEVFHAAVEAVMKKMNHSYECIYINDGSTDRSLEILKNLKKKHHEIKIISFRRNFGQTPALSAGFDHARGEIIVTLDADLQNDPEDIPFMVQKLDEGYDLVSGWRKNRQDSWLRRLPSQMANFIISKVTGIQLHDSGCTLKVYRREVIKDLNLYGQMHRFIPALASSAGISLVEVPVRHHPRRRGQSKYGISRTFRVILDLITVKFLLSYSSSPIQIFGRMGLLSSLLGFLFFAAAVVLKFTQGRTLTGNPLFYLFIFTEMIAVQFVLNGLLGEISIRTYHESQNKKTYVIKEVI